ncbi:MAG: radical SAM protein, partial [Planctomycetota bacterium]
MLVFYEVTRACDLVCRHCRACAAPKPVPGELSSAESQQLIDQLAEFPSPPLLVITGGDPLKRPDLFELITYAKGKGLDVSITPSATPLVTRPAIERLRDCGISRMAISIDGADADTHDAFRGFRGSFDRSLEILRDAHRAGLSTQINTTLTPENIHQVDRMADLFAELSIDLWSVFFLVPVGRGAILPRLSAEQCENAFERLWAHSRTQPYAIKTTEAPHYRRYVIQHQVASGQKRTARPAGFVTRGVNDGKGILFISYCGMIYPSGFLP